MYSAPGVFAPIDVPPIDVTWCPALAGPFYADSCTGKSALTCLLLEDKELLGDNSVVSVLDAASAARLNALRAAPLNRWVALSSDESRIVAEGRTFRDVVVAAEQNGETDPVIVRVPDEWIPRVL